MMNLKSIISRQHKEKQAIADLDSSLKKMTALLSMAEYVLVGAGSGLSVDAGVDYSDEVSFARLFPAMVKRGFRMRYQLMGYSNWTPEVEWGYQAIHSSTFPHDILSKPTGMTPGQLIHNEIILEVKRQLALRI